jgi:hypothetical protein
MSRAEQANKAIVRRLVAEVLNGGRLEVIDELYVPDLAPTARRWITPFRASFPDVHMEVVELIAESDKVAGRFTCSSTNWGTGSVTPHRAAVRAGRRGRHPPAAQRQDHPCLVLEDSLSRLRQLGLIVVPDPGGEL